MTDLRKLIGMLMFIAGFMFTVGVGSLIYAFVAAR